MGDGITGATSLLSGNVGQFVTTGLAITIIGVIVAAIFGFIAYMRGKK
jgi:hypothetical protein